MEHQAVILLSDHVPEQIKLLSGMLNQMNYSVDLVDIRRPENLVCSQQSIVILFLSERYQLNSEFEKLCAYFSDVGSTVFGVFDTVLLEWNRQIINACCDYVSWPCHFNELKLRVEHQVYQSVIPGLETTQAPQEILFSNCPNLVGNSDAFTQVRLAIDKMAVSKAPVLITGETGTGMEVVARTIHYTGIRQNFPFIPVNCGAISDELINEELFGVESAGHRETDKTRLGLIAQASGGTLFLDELDALSSKAQMSLLRFIQDGFYRPLGSDRQKKSDVRIISATKHDLMQLCTEDQFRFDLFLRLNTLSVNLPPLRKRGNDIDLLIEHFLDRFSQQYQFGDKVLTDATHDWMNAYSWPGNVRELENYLHRGYVMVEGDEIDIPCPDSHTDDNSSHLTNNISRQINLSERFSKEKADFITDFEQRYLTLMMCETNGNVSVAAKRAGKERRAFSRLLKKHGILRDQFTE